MPSNSSMLVIQDDVWSGSLHLDEVLLSAIPEAEDGAAAFAFATKDGLNAIFGSEEFLSYCQHGHHFDLYIGIDSVTTPKALEFAKSLSSRLKGKLNVWVYYDESPSSIFHAKTTWLRNQGGDGCIAFVGSGNLTRAGLQKNVEMFSWIEQDKGAFATTLNTWNGWVEAADKAGRLWEVDNETILARASQNIPTRSVDEPPSSGGFSSETSIIDRVPEDSGAVIISQMPKQSGRGWGQFVMTKSFFEDYFGIDLDRKDGQWVVSSTARRHRVLLREVHEDGTIGELESRAGNISRSSSNFRIELAGGHRLEENDDAKIFVVFVKIGAREYLYEINPDSSVWNRQLETFAEENRGALTGKPKCRVSLSTFAKAFQGYPLLKALEALSESKEEED